MGYIMLKIDAFSTVNPSTNTLAEKEIDVDDNASKEAARAPKIMLSAWRLLLCRRNTGVRVLHDCNCRFNSEGGDCGMLANDEKILRFSER